MIDEVGYLLNGRVPSNNGYVIHAFRMCDGFQKSGCKVKLFHSNRTAVKDENRNADPFEYFDIEQAFELVPIPYLDFNRFHGRVDERILRPCLLISHLGFWLSAAAYAWWSDLDLFVTRDWPLAVILVKLGLPTVFEIHKLEGPSFSERGQRAVAAVADDSALRCVVTLTEETAAGLAEVGVPREKVHVEPDAVDLSQYHTRTDKATARAEIDLETDEFLVMYTGSLIAEKGIYDLIRATTPLEDVRLVLVGGTEREQRAVTEFIANHDIDNVDLVGNVPPAEVDTFQRAADVLVLPPTTESHPTKHHPNATSPLKMFEYMAAKRPVVATALPGITDVLTNGENALVTAPGDVERLREAIERLRRDEDLAERLAGQAAEDVREYTWEGRAARVQRAAESE